MGQNIEQEIQKCKKMLKLQFGKYITEKGNAKRIDYINRFIKFTDNKKIILDDVIDVKIND